MKRFIKYHLLLFLLAVMCVPGYAQSVRFRQLNVDNGLSQNSAGIIIQDRFGFIWIATDAGLNRYDGHKVITYRHDPNDKNSLSTNNIASIFADSKDNLWIGTRSGGLNKLDLKTNKITRYTPDPKGNGKLSSPSVYSIAEGSDGKLYMATPSGGVNILDPATDKFTYINYDSTNAAGIKSEGVRKLLFDKKGLLWIVNAGIGVQTYDIKQKKFIDFFHQDATDPQKKLNNARISEIYCDSKNRIWISTWASGFNMYDPNTKTMYSNKDTSSSIFYKASPASMVFNIYEDRSGNIWMACIEAGLICFNPQTGYFAQFKNNPNDPLSLGDNNVLSVYEDKSGLIWAGTLTAGVSIFDPNTYKFGHYKYDPSSEVSLPENQVWSVHKGMKTGKVFLGLKGMVCELDIEKNRFINYVVDKDGNNLVAAQGLIQTLFEDKNGELWYAVNGAGVFRYDPVKKTKTEYHPWKGPKHIMTNTIISIEMDKNQELWFANQWGGIDKYDAVKDEFIHFPYKEGDKFGLTSYSLDQLKIDTKGDLWIATDSGLNVLNTKTLEYRNYRAKKNKKGSLCSDVIHALYCDKEGVMWVGTAFGLCKYNAEEDNFINITEKNKIGADGILGITEDETGKLWLILSKGIACINKYSLEGKVYEYTDGLQSNEFTANACLGMLKGYMLLGGNKGINLFRVKSISSNAHVPDIAITNFSVQNKKVELEKDILFTDEIVLNYDHYFFTIEFASLDFTNPEKNKFKYKLEGFNKDWVELGNNRQVTFVNLDPGEYTFTVIGSNNDGVWNEKGRSIRIIVKPPFWRTTWFYVLCGITIVLLAWAFIKFRERKLVKEKHVLEVKVNERTAELREEKEKVEEAHKEIKDSINYAQKIQTAILSGEDEFKQYYPDSFVLFKPKDIVSGDFYWFTGIDETFVYATADCTGHGVPGGFMSMLGTSLLNEIINEQKILQPEQVLNTLRDKVIKGLKQTGAEGENKDGMDISLLMIEKNTNALKYSAANNPFYLIRNGIITEHKPDKQPIGIYGGELKSFTNHTIQLLKGDCIYTFTDGYPDQFGGPRGKKFKYKQLEEILLEHHRKPMAEQKIIINNIIEQWMHGHEQNDDICIIGLRV